MAPTVTDLPPLRPLSSTPEITWNLDLARWNLSFLLLRKISKNSSVQKYNIILSLFRLFDKARYSIFTFQRERKKETNRCWIFSRNPFDFFLSREASFSDRSGGGVGEIIPWEIRNPTGEIIQVGYAWLHNGSFSSSWKRRRRGETGAVDRRAPTVQVFRQGVYYILSAGRGVFSFLRGVFLCSCTTAVVKTHWRVTWNWRVGRAVSGTRSREGERERGEAFTRPKNCRV